MIKKLFYKCGFKGLSSEDLNIINVDFADQITIKYMKGNYYMESKIKDSFLFLRLIPHDLYYIFPDDVVKIGNLEFLLMKFNIGIGREVGLKTVMEDNELIIQNLKISKQFSASLFCIIDG